MSVKMRATTSFSGLEGFVPNGSIFTAVNEDRADTLKKLGLAERADSNSEVTHEGSLSDLKKDDLENRARALEIKGFSSMNKDELVKAITEAETSSDSTNGNDSPDPEQERATIMEVEADPKASQQRNSRKE